MPILSPSFVSAHVPSTRRLAFPEGILVDDESVDAHTEYGILCLEVGTASARVRWVLRGPVADQLWCCWQLPVKVAGTAAAFSAARKEVAADAEKQKQEKKARKEKKRKERKERKERGEQGAAPDPNAAPSASSGPSSKKRKRERDAAAIPGAGSEAGAEGEEAVGESEYAVLKAVYDEVKDSLESSERAEMEAELAEVKAMECSLPPGSKEAAAGGGGGEGRETKKQRRARVKREQAQEKASASTAAETQSAMAMMESVLSVVEGSCALACPPPACPPLPACVTEGLLRAPSSCHPMSHQLEPACPVTCVACVWRRERVEPS